MIKTEFIYQDNNIKYDEIVESNFPFSIEANIFEIAQFFKLSCVKINLLFKDQLDWEGIFFIKKVEDKLHLCSGGRFGFCGFFPVRKIKSIFYYLDAIDQELTKNKIDSYSITGSIFDAYENIPKKNGWIVSNKTYYITQIPISVSKNGLLLKNFPSKNGRSNIRKGLEAAKKNGINVLLTSDLAHLKEWYERCHIVRIKELEGLTWEYEFFKRLMTSGTAKLVAAFKNDRRLIGGCFTLLSDKMIELFMMSTPQQHLRCGTNYSIISHIYSYALEKDIIKVNWQASNPPDGGGASYKKKWNAAPKRFFIFSKNNNSRINNNYFRSHFKDLFIFPY